MAKESSTIDLLCDDFCLSKLFQETEKEDKSKCDPNETENDHDCIMMLDAEFADDLKLQEVIMASPDTPQPSEDAPTQIEQDSLDLQEEKQDDSTEVGGSSHVICEICAERKGSKEMFTIQSCSHMFCSDCINKHIATKIQDSFLVVTCPGMECKVALDFESCMSIVESHVLERWNEILCESMIPASQRFYCPYRDCSALLVKDSDKAVMESECPICHRLFCAACCVPWHSGIGCEEYQNLGTDEKGREDLMLRELAKQKEWNRCPSCHFYVEKTQGCIHMTCRCSFEFCYACGATWTSTHGGCRPN